MGKKEACRGREGEVSERESLEGKGDWREGESVG